MVLSTTAKEKLERVLGVNDTPRWIALSFAIGVFIAFSPLLGLHFTLALFLIWAFRFNKTAILAGTFINNPWTLVPILAASVWLGRQFCCASSPMSDLPWEQVTWTALTHQFRASLPPFLLGSTILGAFFSIVAYFFMYWAVCRYRRTRPPAATPLRVDSKSNAVI